LVLTFSRGGLSLSGSWRSALWFAIARPRLESVAALRSRSCRRSPCRAGFLAPGLTKDGQPRSLQVHDGRWFALALLLGGIGAFAGCVLRRSLREPAAV